MLPISSNTVICRSAGADSRELSDCHGVTVGAAISSAPHRHSLAVVALKGQFLGSVQNLAISPSTAHLLIGRGIQA